MLAGQFTSISEAARPTPGAGGPAPQESGAAYTVMDGKLFGPGIAGGISLKKLALWRDDPLSDGFKLSQIDLAIIADKADLALSLAEEELAKDPQSISALINKARALAMQGKFQASAAINDQALAFDPADPSALYNKALDLLELGDYAEALKYMDRSIAVDGDYAPAYLHKGQILMKLGRIDEGFACYEKALTTNGFGVLAPYREEYITERLGSLPEVQQRRRFFKDNPTALANDGPA